jgi:hypothetical protein
MLRTGSRAKRSPQPVNVIASPERAKQSPLLHVMQLLKVRNNMINQKIALSPYGLLAMTYWRRAPRNDILRGIAPRNGRLREDPIGAKQYPQPVNVIASDEGAKQTPLLHTMQLLKTLRNLINQKIALSPFGLLAMTREKVSFRASKGAKQCPLHLVIASPERAKQSPLLHVMQLLKVRNNMINQKFILSPLRAPRNDILEESSSQ